MSSYLTYPPLDTSVFPDSYADARKKLLAKIAMSQHHHLSFNCPGKTPEGELLATDVIWLGERSAGNVLILLGGTHGIEGFAGSAIILDSLELFVNHWLTLAPDTALLIVHALTPWGYAWLRRCDEDGVDLNRNYIDFNLPVPENPGYLELRDALFCPDETQRITLFYKFEQRHGRTAFEIAVSGGQYTDPSGPFYGGTQPAHGRQVTEELIKSFHLSEKNLAVVDIHSGLGAYGYGELICDHALDSPGFSIAKRWYGDAATFPALGTSSSVPKLGLMDYLWHKIMNRHSCHVTLEFGTFATDQLFAVLLRDHLLWSQQTRHSEREQHSRLMLRHFCPQDAAWRELVLFRARQVIDQALRGLAGG